MPARGRRETPWGVRAALLLLVGAVSGAFALAIVVGALAPRVATDVVGSVNASLILPEETELPELRERSLVYAADDSLLSILHDAEDRRIVPLEVLPDHVWQAVLTAEDRRFFEHEGYDLEGFGRAALANLRARSISQGGSTITQQLAKMNFLDASQTIDRKFTELLYSMAMEDELEKEELLERYLNQVYFGEGAYGIQAAAEEYFGIAASELRVDQAATLAGVIRAPSANNPRDNPEAANRRRDAILASMVTEGYLPGHVADDLRSREIDVLDEGPDEVREPYVVEAVKQRFLDNPAFGETREERTERLFGGGLEIHTTIDPELQDVARQVVNERFPDEAPTAALASVEPGTGAVRSVYSGRDFEREQFDLALQGRRSPGSSFKPFVMLEALRQGYPPTVTLDGGDDLEITFDDGRQTWEPTNYGGASYGTIDMREATARSVNTYYAQLAMLVGIDDVVSLTEQLGIDRERAYRGVEFPSISLGGLEGGVTPLEMASAYAGIANRGTHVEPYFIDRVVEDGAEVYRADPERTEVVDPAVAGVAIDLLRGVVEGGTGTAARIDGWDVIGKTGTTNDNTDAWFVGTTPVLSTTVWVGHAERQVTMPGATGGQAAAPVWVDFMRRALADAEPVEFPDVDESRLAEVYGGEEIEVPDVVGLEQAEAVRVLAEERLGADVRRVNAFAPAGEVVWQDPSEGASQPLGEPVAIGVSTGRPPTSTVPDVVGADRDSAVANLRNRGFSVRESIVASEAPAGTVVGQSQSPGTTAQHGTTVGITVSSGPPEPEPEEPEEPEAPPEGDGDDGEPEAGGQETTEQDDSAPDAGEGSDAGQ